MIRLLVILLLIGGCTSTPTPKCTVKEYPRKQFRCNGVDKYNDHGRYYHDKQWSLDPYMRGLRMELLHNHKGIR